ncbi:hypothetical protein [Cohnella phaseoli]|uniref:Phage abortive infection protein n=1 Tax=Cohnella phaseoli TaxID=456490 RepID=A0A3D9K9T6_9BACL|nr:hypothetical protein [Cohnella phaseoli]RED83284.1 hypothetical protein DFP98_108127 [Cohnella phaseoli]
MYEISKKNSTDAKKYTAILIVAFMVVVLLPIILEFFIFRNKIYSSLSNGEWGGFLGSYLGGIISGIGTILAVWVTTKETRAIQNKTQDNIENDRRFQRQSQRRAFTDDIARIVSEYIADISGYYYASRHKKDDYIRSLSVKNYYLLKIKLAGIERASDLISELELIHNHHSHGVVETEEFNNVIENLMKNLSHFTSEFIENE